jgi:hypothetical protein
MMRVFENAFLRGTMAIFESWANALKALAVGDRVKVPFGGKLDGSQILWKGKSRRKML